MLYNEQKTKKWDKMSYCGGYVQGKTFTVRYQLPAEVREIFFYKDSDLWYQAVTVENQRGIEYQRSLPINIDDVIAQSLLIYLYGSVDSYIQKVDLYNNLEKVTIYSLGNPYAKPIFSYALSQRFNKYMTRK